MEQNSPKTGCTLSGTKYCDMLHMPNCEACTVRSANAEQIKADLDVLETLLPEAGISTLFDTDVCRLCKGADPGKTACYALVDMGHAEPARKKRNLIGINVKAQTGSMVSAQIACCAACRKKLRILEYLPTVLPLGTAIITLALMMVRPIGDALQRVFQGLPLAIFLGATAIAYLTAHVLGKRLQAKYSEVMEPDVMALPEMQALKARGWFPLAVGKKAVRPVFLKKRLQAGVCTGTVSAKPADSKEDSKTV